MILLLLLFAVGILLFAVEVIVPGGVLGTLGGLCMAGGCVVAFLDFGVAGGILAILAAVVLIGLALYLEFRILPRTRIGRRAFLHAQVTGVSAAVGPEARELIGQPAEALTMLSPSGYVSVAGRRYEAFCQSGQVPAGTPLEVVDADNFRLVVVLPS